MLERTHGFEAVASRPEARLVAAVIAQAIQDLGVRTSAMGDSDRDAAAADAFSFLTDTTGAWAASREHWCLLCDLDGDVLRERVVAFLEGDDAVIGIKTLAVVKPVTAALARERWAERKAVAARREQDWRDRAERRRLEEEERRRKEAERKPEKLPRVRKHKIGNPFKRVPVTKPGSFCDRLPEGVEFTVEDLVLKPWEKSSAWGRINDLIRDGRVKRVRRGVYIKPRPQRVA